eukprot:759640-Hanusia_phi.AAC.4
MAGAGSSGIRREAFSEARPRKFLALLPTPSSGLMQKILSYHRRPPTGRYYGSQPGPGPHAGSFCEQRRSPASWRPFRPEKL